jgi:hypothetical protein
LNPKVHFSKTFLGFQLDSMPQPYIKSTPGGKWNWSTGGTEGGGRGRNNNKREDGNGKCRKLGGWNKSDQREELKGHQGSMGSRGLSKWFMTFPPELLQE